MRQQSEKVAQTTQKKGLLATSASNKTQNIFQDLMPRTSQSCKAVKCQTLQTTRSSSEALIVDPWHVAATDLSDLFKTFAPAHKNCIETS